jgi:ABC-type transport system substrate-binding protein
VKEYRARALSTSLAILGLLMALLTSCTTGRKGDVLAGNGGGGAAVSANVFRYPLTTEPTDYDPARVQDGTTIDLLQQIFEGLVKWSEQNEIVPNLAEKWKVSPDGKTYTFTLKKGVKFHNGREMTAEDFKYSLERACDPATQSQTSSSYLKDIVGAMDKINGKATEISGIKVIDPYTLSITIDAFKPYWLGNMTYPTGYVVCKEAIEQNGNVLDHKAAVGTGPFKLAEVRAGYEVTLAAHPDYHGGKPKLDFIARPILKDANTRLSKYEADELDLVVIAPGDLDRVQQDAKLKAEMKSFARPAIWYVGMNQDAPGSPFKKKEVRQAFAMAIDPQEVIRVALKGQADLANGILPPGVLGHNPNVKPLPYDPAKAKQLLAQAGYPDGKGFPTLTFSFRQDQPEVGAGAQVVAQQLKKNLGINLQLRPMEWGQFLKERSDKTMPLSYLRWAADYLDAQNFLSLLLHSSQLINGQETNPENGVGYNNPVFDRLCEQADVERDPQKRIALYQQAEQLMLEDAPWRPLYFQRDVELIKPRVKGLRDSLFGHLPHTTTQVMP